MSFVIYDTRTTKALYLKNSKPYEYGKRTYETEGAAKAAITRFLKKCPATIKNYRGEDIENVYHIPRGFLAIAEASEYYSNIEGTRMVRNLMSGKMVEESVNTPYGCSVASENYWCS